MSSFIPAEKRRLQGCCIDCGRKYGDEHGFPDLVIPNDAWKAISPTGDDGGLLCPSCICRRLHDAGITTTGRFTSGPLCGSDDFPRAGAVLRAVSTLSGEFTTADARARAPNAQAKEIYNALGYLTRKKRIKRLGYGRYRKT